MKEIILKDALKEVDKSRAKEIEACFMPMIIMLKSFELEYARVMAKEITPENCEEAKHLLSEIAQIRIKAEKEKTKQKKKYLIAGGAIQGAFNILKHATNEKEDALKARAKHFENIEKARIEKLNAERLIELQKYDPNVLYSDDLGDMDIERWDTFLAGAKYHYNLRIEAEQKEEKERLEAEQKKETYDKRLRLLLPYKSFYQSSLTLETTEPEFKKLWDECYLEDEKEKAEIERIAKENEDLKIKLEKAELKTVEISPAGTIKETSENEIISNLLDHMFDVSDILDSQANKDIVLNARLQILHAYIIV